MNSGVNSGVGGCGFADNGPTIVRLPPPPGSSGVESSTNDDTRGGPDDAFSTIGPVDPSIRHHSSSAITTPPSSSSASSSASSSSWPYEQGTWDNDVLSSHCRKCHGEFDNFLQRKHHCRLCGRIFCHDCTSTRCLIPHSALVLRNQKDGNGLVADNYDDDVVAVRLPNLETRILLSRQPRRTCLDCSIKLRPYQLELRSVNSNSVRYNYIDDNDVVRRLCNSPIAFTLGHEVRKAAYALGNILPGNSNNGSNNSSRRSRNSGPFQDSDAILYSYQPTSTSYSSSSSSDYGCQIIPTTKTNNNNIGGGGGCRTIDPTLRNIDGMSIPPKLLARAYGIAIVTCCKGGFGFAGIEFGTGLVVARRRRRIIGQQQQQQVCDDDNEWTAPCAIGVTGFAWGALLGAQVSDHIFLLMTEDAVRLFTSSNGRSIQLGADVGVALGPVGRSAEADWSATTGPSRDLLDEQYRGRGVGGDVVMAPIFTYSLSKGLYAGVSLDGRLLMTRDRVNEKFYGRTVTAHELLSGSVPNPPAAQPLYDALKRCRVYGERAGGAGVVDGGVDELPIIRGGGNRTLDVSTIEHDYYSSDDYGMNEYGMNGTPIRNGNSFVGGMVGITYAVRDDGFVDYGVQNVIDTRGGGNADGLSVDASTGHSAIQHEGGYYVSRTNSLVDIGEDGYVSSPSHGNNSGGVSEFIQHTATPMWNEALRRVAGKPVSPPATASLSKYNLLGRESGGGSSLFADNM